MPVGAALFSLVRLFDLAQRGDCQILISGDPARLLAVDVARHCDLPMCRAQLGQDRIQGSGTLDSAECRRISIVEKRRQPIPAPVECLRERILAADPGCVHAG